MRPFGMLGCLAAGLMMLAASAAMAIDDYTLGSPQNGYMPDFDQRRDYGPLVFDGMSFVYQPPGLPNGGRMYCVPTATLNAMAYLANHGYPSAMPGGESSWQSDDYYDAVTAAIFEMGDLMETDPEDGTSDKGAYGCREWLDTHIGENMFIVDSHYASKSYGPNLYEIAAAGHLGQLVLINVGWYEHQSGGQWIRTGGHMLTLTGAYQNDGFFLDGCQIRLRDPGGTSGGTFSQAGFSNRTLTLDYVLGQFSNKSEAVTYYNRTMAKLPGYSSGSKQGFLHGFRTITACFGIGDGPQLDIFNPFPIDPDPLPWQQTLANPIGVSIADFAIHPNKTCVLFTARDAAGAILPDVYCLDRVNGTTTPLFSAPGLKSIECSGARTAYVLTDVLVTSYDLDAPSAPAGVMSLPIPVDTMAYDDVGRRLFCLSATTQQMLIASPDLASFEIVPLPSSVELSGEPFMTICPSDGMVWIKAENSRTIYELEYGIDLATGGPGLTIVDSITDLALLGATGIDNDGNDHIYWVKDGVVRRHGRGPGGGWTEETDHPFAGATAARRFRLARAADTIDPAEYLDASFRNDLPDDSDTGDSDCGEGSTDDCNDNLIPDVCDIASGFASDCNGNGIPDQCDIDSGYSVDADGNGIPDECEAGIEFDRGDCNGDGNYDIADGIATLSYLFTGSGLPSCLDACDSNDDGAIDIGDGVYTLSALFSGGAPPPAPHAACGSDPTEDALDCVSSSCP